MSAVAEYKGIRVDKLEVYIEPQIEEERGTWHTCFRTRVELGVGLTRRERTMLYNAARTCEVHKLLSGEITFENELVGEL